MQPFTLPRYLPLDNNVVYCNLTINSYIISVLFQYGKLGQPTSSYCDILELTCESFIHQDIHTEMDSQEAGKMQTIEIDKLNVQQLSQMKQQLDQEVGLFNDSLQQLKVQCHKSYWCHVSTAYRMWQKFCQL